MFSSISKRTAEAEKRESETGKCNQQVFHKTPARKRHDRFSQVCPKKYLHTYIYIVIGVCHLKWPFINFCPVEIVNNE